MKKRSQTAGAFRKYVLPAIIILDCLLMFSYAVGNLEAERGQEDFARMEDVLKRSCVACYAAEGRYPPSIAYLEQSYGLQLDHTRYTVYYTIFAENLMPDITVLEKVS